MTEQIKSDQVLIPPKLSIKDLDFDNLDDDELNMIKEEIEVIMKIRELKGERMNFIKKQIVEEKEKLRIQMLRELKKEKDRLLSEIKEKIKEKEEDEDEDDSDSVIESVIYNKKKPKRKDY